MELSVRVIQPSRQTFQDTACACRWTDASSREASSSLRRGVLRRLFWRGFGTHSKGMTAGFTVLRSLISNGLRVAAGRISGRGFRVQLLQPSLRVAAALSL